MATDTSADVCIVGAGLTGLWTAYYLKQARPQLHIVVVERRFAGYGASGRNGGWLSNFLAGSRRRYAAAHGRAGVVELQQAMDASVAETIRAARAEGIDADIVESGLLTVTRSPAQVERLHRKIVDDEQWGVCDQRMLTASELDARLDVAGALGGAYSPRCARVNPAKLARGLAQRVAELGVVIHEDTPALRVRAGVVETPAATVRAESVVLAVEGFTAQMSGRRRQLLPMNSSMIVTEPLPDRVWDKIGWRSAELLGDMAHMYFYAQRTADGRIALGGRGNPYRFGSRIDIDGRTSQATIESLHALLLSCFPAVRGVPLAHAWSGVLGVPRDWCSAVRRDERTGMILVGGYTGHGVTTTNLAGRTIRDLILGTPTALTRLPWVHHTSRRWEPEPLRWLGVHALYRAYRFADSWEQRRKGGTCRLATVADRIAGR